MLFGLLFLKSSNLVIKVKYGDLLRRMNARVIGDHLDINMTMLKQHISVLFNFELSSELIMTYVDEDGDDVMLCNDSELRDIVKQALNPLRITVQLADKNVYDIVAKEKHGKQISFAFLDRIKSDFKKGYGKADAAVAKSLNNEFGLLMTGHMQYMFGFRPKSRNQQHLIDHADKNEELLKVKAQLSEVKSIVLQNIEKAVKRGENLTVLRAKADDLRNSVQDFKLQGKQIHRKMWYQSMKTKLIVSGILSFCHLIFFFFRFVRKSD